MKQRLIAVLASLGLLALMAVVAAVVRLPFVEYSPGPSFDVLGEKGGQEIVEVSGHKAYRDDGELRMTTVYVSPPKGGINLFAAVSGWLDDERAVVPYESVYPDHQTPEDADRESAVQMVSSQDSAVAAALTELGYHFEDMVEVLSVSQGMPAEGKLEVGDELVKVGDTTITNALDVVKAVETHAAGTPLEFRVRRDGATKVVEVTPTEVDGKPRVGIVPGPGFRFPFDVNIDISEGIGGPSAGLLFSLAIYDTLTPGSLTGGESVAGTGTIDAKGSVGPIGGIAQKIVGARQDGAELFLVPRDNCAEALKAENGDMRLVRADDLDGTIKALDAWRADPEADVPTCEDWMEWTDAVRKKQQEEQKQ